MIGLYLFAAAAGVPLVLWFFLSGAEEGGDSGTEAGESGDGIGGVMLRLLPLSTIAIVLATFGVTGLILHLAVGGGSSSSLPGAVLAAVVAGALNSGLFAYLRRSDSNAAVLDEQLTGAMGRVVLPVGPEHRGRIVVAVGGQQSYFTARRLASDGGDDLEAGASVLVVDVSGGVATVVRLDAELT